MIRAALSRVCKAVIGVTDNPSVAKPGEDMALFIGGPWHSQWRTFPVGQMMIPCEPGEYLASQLGFDGHVYELVYVWSGTHFDEALDFVLGRPFDE